MGMENLMVELGRRYYLNGLTEWSDSTWLKNLEEEIYKNERSLVGMKAANIPLADVDNNYKKLYFCYYNKIKASLKLAFIL